MHIRISKTVSILPYLAQRQISNALSRQRKVEIAALWRRLYSVCRHNGVIEASFPRTFDRDGSNFQSVPPADDKAVTNCVISSRRRYRLRVISVLSDPPTHHHLLSLV